MSGCLDATPGSAPIDAGVPGDAAAPDAAPPSPVMGDLLTLTFDDPFHSEELLRDRSGSHRHADPGTSRPADGSIGSAYGGARNLVDLEQEGILVPRGAKLIALQDGAGLTVEAWVRRKVDGEAAVFGDFDPSVPSVNFSMEISADGRLGFITNDGGVTVSRVAAGGVIPLDQWTHLAVAWDRERVRFYVDGERVGDQELATDFMFASAVRLFEIGRRPNDTLRLIGGVDEVKVSSRAKTQEEIQASMAFDSTALIAACEDGFIEGAEDCVADALCCSQTCGAEDDGACPGACDDEGVCRASTAERVTEGLVAYYTFDGTGTTVPDLSDVFPPLDLTISNDGSVVHTGTSLRVVDATTILSNAVDSERIRTACNIGDQVTVEAWVTPALDDDPVARDVVTFQDALDSRNFALRQDGGFWCGRVRNQNTQTNGRPGVDSAPGDAAGGVLQHVVVTAAADQGERIYLDGRLRDIGLFPDKLSTWADGARLSLANDVDGTALWQGELHLVAVYCRALTAAEVAQNFAAGEDP